MAMHAPRGQNGELLGKKAKLTVKLKADGSYDVVEDEAANEHKEEVAKEPATPADDPRSPNGRLMPGSHRGV